MAPGAETMVLPATSVHSTAEAGASCPPVGAPGKQSSSSSSSSSDKSMDYTTPKRFRVKNVTLPEASNAEKSGDNAVTPSTVGPAETPDSVVTAANPVTASSAETSLTGADVTSGQQLGDASGFGNSSTAAELELGGGAVSAAERVKMNSRSCKNRLLQPHQQQLVANNSKALAAFTQITPSIKLGPRIALGDNDRGEEDAEMKSPPPVMKLNMHQRGQSGQEFEQLPTKMESSTAALPDAAVPCTSSIAIQNVPQQKQQQPNRFKVEHQLPPPTFLAAKISPLRSKSSRAKKGDAKPRGKTPPLPSSAIAAASNADQSNLLSPGMFLAPRTPRNTQSANLAGAKAAGMTPTNFASDFGKGLKQQDPIQYDPANSFAWLDTPGGHGLFSPSGGLTTYSAHNTPRGMYGFLGSAKTPGGTMSDAEVLKANGDLGVNTPKVPEAQHSMINISPLNSTKKGKSKTFSVPETPMSINYSEIFASPQSTIRRSDIHTAENIINIDADLNALLQLAETTTPGGTRPVTFMSPVLSTHLRRQSTNGDCQGGEPPSSLQLPIITGSSTTAAEKGTPQLSIRSTTNGKCATKGSGRKRGRPPKNKNKSVDTPASKPQQQQQYQEHPVYPQPQVLHYHGGAPQQYYHHPAHHHHQGWVYPGQPPQYAYADQQQQAASMEQSEVKTDTRGRVKRRASKAPGSSESDEKRVRRAITPKKVKTPQEPDPQENEKIEAAIGAVRRSGGKQKKNPEDKGQLPRGVTMRPSGKWQAQLYYAGKSRYIGVFDTREKACLAYEISREVLKTDKGEDPKPSEIEANINLARKAAFAGVGKN